MANKTTPGIKCKVLLTKMDPFGEEFFDAESMLRAADPLLNQQRQHQGHASAAAAPSDKNPYLDADFNAEAALGSPSMNGPERVPSKRPSRTPNSRRTRDYEKMQKKTFAKKSQGDFKRAPKLQHGKLIEKKPYIDSDAALKEDAKIDYADDAKTTKEPTVCNIDEYTQLVKSVGLMLISMNVPVIDSTFASISISHDAYNLLLSLWESKAAAFILHFHDRHIDIFGKSTERGSTSTVCDSIAFPLESLPHPFVFALLQKLRPLISSPHNDLVIVHEAGAALLRILAKPPPAPSQ